MKLKMVPISKWESNDTYNIALSGPMSPMCAAKDFVSKVFDNGNMVITGLFRILAEGETTFTTWEHADLNPVQIDVICVVLNFRHMAVFGEIGSRYMPIALILDGDAQFSELYTTYNWISAPTVEEIAGVVGTINLQHLRQEFEDFRWQVKGEQADDWLMEQPIEKQLELIGIKNPRNAFIGWVSISPKEKYLKFKSWTEKN